MVENGQILDNVVAFGVTAGILIFGSYYYYSIVRVPDNVQKSLDLKKKLTQAVKKPLTSSSNGASRPKSSKPSGQSATMQNVSLDEGSNEMKGYKMTSDGRKTTYFNREITEEEKILLGDSTPKPLISTTSASSSGKSDLQKAASGVSPAGSAWNTAGTWEERNQSPWAKKHFGELLKSSSLGITANTKEIGMIHIVKVSSIEGDASITLSRGKKKYIYDYTISLDWKLQIGVSIMTGSVTVSDINAECDYEFDISVSPSNPSTLAVRENIQKYVRQKNAGLQLLIKQKLDRFLVDLMDSRP